MKEILFLGPLYPVERENEIKQNAILKPSNAPNVYQWSLLSGLHEIAGRSLDVINVLPVGTWKHAYSKLFLKDNDWTSNGVNGHEVGCINLPFVKQWMRSNKIKKLLKKSASEDTEIIIYSAYMPFLKAAYHLPAHVKITAIIADLPEFYDLGSTSPLKKALRAFQNRMIYKYLDRVDRFVVLTDQMCEPLHVGKRPWIRIEGIYDPDSIEPPSVPHEKMAIMYSGTLHYRYGIKNLLDAFEKVESDEIELWICGSGEAEKEITELAQKDSRVTFFGFCSQREVAELRAKAAILVNPRTNEGEYTKYSFPSKTMEYMASGKPVVMYKLDGVPEEYDEYLNYVSTVGMPCDCWRDALLDVLLHYEDSKSKANNGKNYVLNNKSSIIQACKVVDLITGTLNVSETI